MPPITDDDLKREADDAANYLWDNPMQDWGEDEVNAQFEAERRPGFNAEAQNHIESDLRSRIESQLRSEFERQQAQSESFPPPQQAVVSRVALRRPLPPPQQESRSHFESELPAKIEAEYQKRMSAGRTQFQNRFKAAGASLLKRRPNSEAEWKSYYENYAEMVRQEAIQKFAERLNSSSTTATSPLDVDLEQAANRWIAGVRAHDKWTGSPLFNNKVRGHGQADGSTDGRLRRKLVKAAIQHAIKNNPNEDVVSKLNSLRTLPIGASALRKALFLTQEKLSDPERYKQKYSRVIPFGDNGWVKASRRFYIPANAPLALPLRTSDKTQRTTTTVKMSQPPDGLQPFGPNTQELIHDVGQKGLGECWLQASAASLPRSTLGNMFSWRPSYGGTGVTVRLHDEQGRPMYIRTQNNQVWNNASAHKALWPAALAVAAAKVGRNDLREFRKDYRISSRDQNTGMPVYSVRDVYGNTSENASRLLTGKAPLIDKDVSSLSPREKKALIGNLLAEAQTKGSQSGTATFGNFDNPNGGDEGPGHSVTFLGVDPNDDNIATFGNPWAADPYARDDGSLSHGKKIFKARLARMRRLTFLDPRGADPDNDRYVVGQYPRPIEHIKRYIGNLSAW